YWPVFNLADSAIVCGGILTVLLALLGYHLDGTHGDRSGANAGAGASAGASPSEPLAPSDQIDRSDGANAPERAPDSPTATPTPPDKSDMSDESVPTDAER
ncbi:MAG: hypothetical protein ACRDN0_08895, partial [Trebonia sp.]